MSSFVTPYDPAGGDAGLDRIEAPAGRPPAVFWLVVAGVAVAFVQATVEQRLPLYLGFPGAGVARSGAWWTALTYLFVHAGFWHLALNLYTLWVFGPRLERAWGTRTFLAFYAWCGIGGAVAFALFGGAHGLLVGASAAIFGVLVAYAVRWPRDEALFFGVVPMRVSWLVGFLVAVNLVMGVLDVAGGPAGAAIGGTSYLAHLGGVVFAALWLFRPPAPDVDRLRQRVAPAPDLIDGLPRAFPPRQTPRERDVRGGRAEPRGSAADQAVEQSKALTLRPAPPTIIQPPQPPVRPAGGGTPPASPNAPSGPPPATTRDGGRRGRRHDDPPVGERTAGGPATPPAGPPTPPPPVARPARRLPAPRSSSVTPAAGANPADVMNELLDKISAGGVESLTEEERRQLEDAANRLRGPS